MSAASDVYKRQAIRQNVSTAALARTLQGTFYQTGVGTLRRLRRMVQAEINAGAYVRNLTRVAHFNPNRLPTAATQIHRNYSFDVEVFGIDDNFERTSHFVTVTTDTVLTRAEIEDKAMDAMNRRPENYVARFITGADIMVGRRRA